ncbi:uncharacterized protein LACBIDRAFT_321633 [Laccaria bicolor S238N-H82]|uniref:Predicted protein n=1 Tax=Laccaria bicolor (strain S238N-H82 / ATCC MYA-4686) TaxID=486041 RepID=B0CTM0_LACBS|nr:uncharacterized protein LACBIDRAFT_321633 [Laccaria bicolor S238N-H82]EDR13944.1 predicted protein [Laccaria bicolor S238N-H82]|eukprot:XP_001874503.1 predicted protein [Laccaria bicolor S238N-H82]
MSTKHVRSFDALSCKPLSTVEVHPSLSVVPPIERLPVEILAEIFILCISYSDHPPLISRSTEPPISLCCVCKRWQKIASELPRLWTAALVCTESIKLEVLNELPQLLYSWFSRSNQLPLSLKFTSDDYNVMNMFTACVAPFASRFCHLDVDLNNFICSSPTDLQLSASQPTQTQLTHPDRSWSTLQFLQLESAIIRGNIEVHSDLETPLFSFAPRLQRLRMDNISFIGGTPLQLVLPWSQLTHLILVNLLESHLWLQLFPMCPALQHGLFDVFEDFVPTPSTAERATFHHLTDLTFAFNDPINPSILGHFDFPALKTLRLSNDSFISSDGGDLDDSMFWTATTRSRLYQQVAPLERLSLNGSWPFVCIFEAATHVVELDLDDSVDVSEAVHSPLRLRLPYGYSLLPNLRVLSMSINLDFQIDVLADIIISRRSVDCGIRIEKLTLYPSGMQKYMKRLTEKLQPLINDGFIVEICDTTSHWCRQLDPTWREGIIEIEG